VVIVTSLVLAIHVLPSETQEANLENSGGDSSNSSSTITTAASQTKCFACGLEEIDPERDEPGSYGDSRREGVPKTKKMYNHTCDIAEKMGFDDRWVRTCPPGVRSCFWAEARYEKQVPLFRGCANATFAHDERCSRELQAVQIVWGKRSEDVEIKLCFCNGEKCNEKDNGAMGLKAGINCRIFLIGVISIYFSTFIKNKMI